MNQSFHWKRFWCEPDKQFQLDDSGYLLKPDGEYGKYFEHVPLVVEVGSDLD